MATTATTANAVSLKIGESYTMSITGFTYIKEYALIKGKESTTGEAMSVIIGDKLSFGMRDMFELKNSNGIRAIYRKDTVSNGVTYKQFQLEEILF